MESFLAAIAGHRGDDATAKAQDVMYEAWERTTSRSRIALARKALGISPLCADVYVLLAEEARSIEEARDYYAKVWAAPPRIETLCPWAEVGGPRQCLRDRDDTRSITARRTPEVTKV